MNRVKNLQDKDKKHLNPDGLIYFVLDHLQRTMTIQIEILFESLKAKNFTEEGAHYTSAYTW